MADYQEHEDLPLPSFIEVFGDGTSQHILANNSLASAAAKKKSSRRPGSRGTGSGGDESTGRWTPDEQRRFLEGLMLYGKDWKKMAPLIKTRTLVQIRTHAQKVFKKMGFRADTNKANRGGRKRTREDGADEIQTNRNSSDGNVPNHAMMTMPGLSEGNINNNSSNVLSGDDDDDIEIDERQHAQILSQIAAHDEENNNNMTGNYNNGLNQPSLHQLREQTQNDNSFFPQSFNHQYQQQQQSQQQHHSSLMHQHMPQQMFQSLNHHGSIQQHQEQQLLQHQHLGYSSSNNAVLPNQHSSHGNNSSNKVDNPSHPYMSSISSGLTNSSHMSHFNNTNNHQLPKSSPSILSQYQQEILAQQHQQQQQQHFHYQES